MIIYKNSNIFRGRVDSDESPLRKPRAFDSGSDSDSGKNGKMADGSKAGLNSKEDWVKGRPKKTKNSNMAQLIEDAKNQETVYREKGIKRLVLLNLELKMEFEELLFIFIFKSLLLIFLKL